MRNPSGICQCGCGLRTAKAKESRRGYKRGEPLLHIRGHNRSSGPDYGLDEAGCWIWQKATTSHGYGHTYVDGVAWMAHRLYYTRVHGKIADGLEIHHVCGVPACVNPEHLEALTRREHMRTEGRKAYGRYETKGAVA